MSNTLRFFDPKPYSTFRTTVGEKIQCRTMPIQPGSMRTVKQMRRAAMTTHVDVPKSRKLIK
jgi:hypothetical protein